MVYWNGKKDVTWLLVLPLLALLAVFLLLPFIIAKPLLFWILAVAAFLAGLLYILGRPPKE